MCCGWFLSSGFGITEKMWGYPWCVVGGFWVQVMALLRRCEGTLDVLWVVAEFRIWRYWEDVRVLLYCGWLLSSMYADTEMWGYPWCVVGGFWVQVMALLRRYEGTLDVLWVVFEFRVWHYWEDVRVPLMCCGWFLSSGYGITEKMWGYPWCVVGGCWVQSMALLRRCEGTLVLWVVAEFSVCWYWDVRVPLMW